MFVSCHPTVPKNDPDPIKYFCLFYKNHPKNTVVYNFLPFFLVTKFSSDMAYKIHFGVIKKKE